MHIRRHPDPGWGPFFKRTISAQSHFIGCGIAFIGLIILMFFAGRTQSLEHLLACAVFGVSGMLVFGTSAVYHFLHDGFRISEKLMQILEDLDHAAIYIFIAGTYTPFLLNVVSQPWRTYLLIAVWSVAITGIAYTRYKPFLPRWAQHRGVYTGLFLVMGWTMLVRIGEVIENLSTVGLGLFLGGCLTYTIGALIYAFRWPRLFENVFGFHELWHLMVIFGFSFHYAMILGFYLP